MMFGLAGDEGTLSLCTFWYVDALARAGGLDEARLTFEKMHTYANHLGLYSEEIGSTGEQLGNFPQAFSHLALISAAINLDYQLDHGAGLACRIAGALTSRCTPKLSTRSPPWSAAVVAFAPSGVSYFGAQLVGAAGRGKKQETTPGPPVLSAVLAGAGMAQRAHPGRDHRHPSPAPGLEPAANPRL